MPTFYAPVHLHYFDPNNSGSFCHANAYTTVVALTVRMVCGYDIVEKHSIVCGCGIVHFSSGLLGIVVGCGVSYSIKATKVMKYESEKRRKTFLISCAT